MPCEGGFERRLAVSLSLIEKWRSDCMVAPFFCLIISIRRPVRPDQPRLPPVRVVVPASGLQYLHLRLLHRSEQRRRVRRHLFPADAGVPVRLGADPAHLLRCGRHLVGHHRSGGVRVPDLRDVPAGQARQISLYVRVLRLHQHSDILCIY